MPKLDLPGELNVSATFNVADLSPFHVGDDLGSNRFQEGGNDTITTNNESEEFPIGPMTRAKTKKFQEAMGNLFIQGWKLENATPTMLEQYSLLLVHEFA